VNNWEKFKNADIETIMVEFRKTERPRLINNGSRCDVFAEFMFWLKQEAKPDWCEKGNWVWVATEGKFDLIRAANDGQIFLEGILGGFTIDRLQQAKIIPFTGSEAWLQKTRHVKMLCDYSLATKDEEFEITEVHYQEEEIYFRMLPVKEPTSKTLVWCADTLSQKAIFTDMQPCGTLKIVEEPK
jgi:hypothetical protein